MNEQRIAKSPTQSVLIETLANANRLLLHTTTSSANLRMALTVKRPKIVHLRMLNVRLKLSMRLCRLRGSVDATMTTSGLETLASRKVSNWKMLKL